MAGGRSMTGNAEQATDRQQRRRWTVAAVTLAVNLGSFLYLVLVAALGQPGYFRRPAALAGIALLFEVPANALQVALGRAVAARARRARCAGRCRGAASSTHACLGAGVCAVLLALSPLVEGSCTCPRSRAPSCWGLRPAGGYKRRAQGRAGRPGPAALVGNRPDRRDGRADRCGCPPGPPWRRP